MSLRNGFSPLGGEGDGDEEDDGGALGNPRSCDCAIGEKALIKMKTNSAAIGLPKRVLSPSELIGGRRS